MILSSRKKTISATGCFRASYVRAVRRGDCEVLNEAEIKGFISNLNTEEGTFTLAGLTVRYNLETQFNDGRRLRFSDLNLSDALEIDGLDTSDSEGRILQAVKIERDDVDDDDCGGSGPLSINRPGLSRAALRKLWFDTVTALGPSHALPPA